ncbi:site-specific integrase [Bacillus sp. FSL K6-1012]|uniref:tyrosine-type recombinase/integrase n=1 Tax=Bacillus TaxID=1386 RepID=UPI0030D5AE1C
MASYRKRGDNWEYRITYDDPITKKRKEKTKKGFRTKREAQIAAAEIEKNLYFGKHSLIQNREKLVKDWLQEWMEVYGLQCEKRTRINRELYLQTHIIPRLGNFKLQELNRVEYQKFINELCGKYARTTVQTIHSIFCSAINKAVEHELVSHNKFQNVSIKSDSDFRKLKNNYLDKSQVTVFMNAARTLKYHHYIIALTLLRTGLRKGELIALYWSDVNLEKKTITVTKSKNEYGIKPPKTKASVRTIAIDNTLVNELTKYKDWQEKNKEMYGEKYNDSPFFITTPKGKDFGPYAINKVIDAVLEKTDLHHITPHGLRHTHAIMLLESGADLKYVSERLGHTTVNMTADVYIHITKKHNKKSIDQFEEYLNA